jgi:hypothetical protein
MQCQMGRTLTVICDDSITLNNSSTGPVNYTILGTYIITAATTACCEKRLLRRATGRYPGQESLTSNLSSENKTFVIESLLMSTSQSFTKHQHVLDAHACPKTSFAI